MVKYLLPLVLAVLLCACGAAATTTRQQTVDGVTVSLEQPPQATLLKEYQLIIGVRDAAGKPIDGANVYLDMHMPSMAMAPNTPLADPLGNGRYGARTLFSMEGDWEVQVHVEANGKQYRAVFDQVVVPAS